jgi:hypothetical protein
MNFYPLPVNLTVWYIRRYERKKNLPMARQVRALLGTHHAADA